MLLVLVALPSRRYAERPGLHKFLVFGRSGETAAWALEMGVLTVSILALWARHPDLPQSQRAPLGSRASKWPGRFVTAATVTSPIATLIGVTVPERWQATS